LLICRRKSRDYSDRPPPPTTGRLSILRSPSASPPSGAIPKSLEIIGACSTIKAFINDKVAEFSKRKKKEVGKRKETDLFEDDRSVSQACSGMDGMVVGKSKAKSNSSVRKLWPANM